MSELSGKGYRNVRRGRGKKGRDEEQVTAAFVSPVGPVGIQGREHMGYAIEVPAHHLTAWAQERLLAGRLGARVVRRRGARRGAAADR